MTEKSRNTKQSGVNQLINEKSPYLIQHAHQPVDWYAWGESAFEKARREDKPLLVSIGYSTCHWCHVMAEESFDDPHIADLMNRFFVSVKVDREERPDVDALYITAVSSLTGSAGWPLNVFLTPDGKPFYGGTYFPPQSRHGMPGWPDVLRQIHQAWKNPEQRAKIESSAKAITQSLKQHLSDAPDQSGQTKISIQLIEKAIQAFAGDYDAQNGGFSNAPKFPMPPILQFLLTFYQFSAETGQGASFKEQALQMVTNSLDTMGAGGIYDHIGGGFHRYSTDQYWHVPHFEKMLYDNAQLIKIYTNAYLITGNQQYADVVKQSTNYVLRDMAHPDGGFYSAEDADSVPPELEVTSELQHPPKREGAFYVWPYQEVTALLKDQADDLTADIACYLFDIRETGNVSNDPFGEFEGQNVLHQVHSLAEAAERFNLSEAAITEKLNQARQILFQARSNRPRPHLDDKILTGWNGLMISALARASRAFNSTDYLFAAEKAAGFIYEHLYDDEKGLLYRRWREGEAKVSGLADDYAFLINGLIDLYETNFNPWLLEWAVELMNQFLAGFVNQDSGMVYLTPKAHDPYLAFQMKDFIDNVTPSAASGGVMALIRLSRITGNNAMETAADTILRYASGEIARSPRIAPYLLSAAMIAMTRHVHIVITGSLDKPDTGKMIEAGRIAGGLGQSMVVVCDVSDRDTLSRVLPDTTAITLPEAGAAAQVCFNQACRPTVDSAEKLIEQLASVFN